MTPAARRLCARHVPALCIGALLGCLVSFIALVFGIACEASGRLEEALLVFGCALAAALSAGVLLYAARAGLEEVRDERDE